MGLSGGATISGAVDVYTASNMDNEVTFSAQLDDGVLYEVSNDDYHIQMALGSELVQGNLAVWIW